jgi:hypothetical protein
VIHEAGSVSTGAGMFSEQRLQRTTNGYSPGVCVGDIEACIGEEKKNICTVQITECGLE